MLQEIYQIDIEIYVKVDISILSFPYAWLLQIIVQESYVPSKSSTLVLRLAFGGGLDGPRSPVCMDVVKIIESYGYNAVNPLYRRSSGVCCHCIYLHLTDFLFLIISAMPSVPSASSIPLDSFILCPSSPSVPSAPPVPSIPLDSIILCPSTPSPPPKQRTWEQALQAGT